MKVLRTSSVEEWLSKAQGTYTGITSSASKQLLYISISVMEKKLATVQRKYFISDDIKSAALNPKKRQFARTLNGLRTTTAVFLTSPNTECCLLFSAAIQGRIREYGAIHDIFCQQ